MLLVIVTALAAEPTQGIHAVGGIDPDGPAAGIGGSVGLAIGAADLELAADAAFGPGAVGLVRPQVRLHPFGVGRIAPHVVLGGGVRFRPGEDGGAGLGGLGIDLARTPWRPRLQVLAHLGQDGTAGGLLTLGFAHRRAQPTPTVAPDAVSFDAAMVWVPGPVCRWLPADDAGTAFLGVDADPAVVSRVPRPPEAAPGADGAASRPLGDLVVAALPGDLVEVDGLPLEVAADGVAWTQLPEGPATVRILGGGRRSVFDLAVSADATLWLAAAQAVPLELRFELGSAELEGPSAAALDAFGDQLGGWGVHVWGSYSEEGDRAANEALALRRAESTRDRLVRQGIPRERIEVLPPRTPSVERALEAQRIAVVQPVAPEAP